VSHATRRLSLATLDDLPIPELSTYSREEGINLILSIRARRSFVQDKPAKERKSTQRVPSAAVIDKLSDKQLTDLYYKLMAKSQKEMFS
jgi:hypothetical protein